MMHQYRVLKLQTVISSQLSHLTGEEVQITDQEAIFFATVLWGERALQPKSLIAPSPDSRV
jgi:hypothetical protein